jgi:hypothetical protein
MIGYSDQVKAELLKRTVERLEKRKEKIEFIGEGLYYWQYPGPIVPWKDAPEYIRRHCLELAGVAFDAYEGFHMRHDERLEHLAKMKLEY